MIIAGLCGPACLCKVLTFYQKKLDSLQAEHILVPLAAIRAGKGYMTEQGSTEHAFDL